MKNNTLALAGTTHAKLREHLFPGDGLEAAAILLCTRTPGPRLRLLVRDVILVPHGACASRRPDRIVWPGRYLEEAVEQGEIEGLSVILLHSHPGGSFFFSDTDDASDLVAVNSLFQAYGDLHGSAIMTPDGALRARIYDSDMRCSPIDLVSCAGDELSLWWEEAVLPDGPGDRPIAFTSAMTAELGRLTAVVIGASGTGSIQAEQAARLGFGRVIPIDYDKVKKKNLNRILNATRADAVARRYKTNVLARAIATYRGKGCAVPIVASINTREAVLAASQGDVLFCCVDSLEGRYFADLIASAFLLPLFDVGVAIPVRRKDGTVAIADAVGRIDYVQPGGATLRDRNVYTPETLRAEYLRRAAPEAHAQEVEDGYIRGVVEEAPAVISLNMRAASACMNEFILRRYPFRLDPNRRYARTTFSLAAAEEDFYDEDSFDKRSNPLLGRGSREPLLGMPALGATTAETVA